MDLRMAMTNFCGYVGLPAAVDQEVNVVIALLAFLKPLLCKSSFNISCFLGQESTSLHRFYDGQHQALSGLGSRV